MQYATKINVAVNGYGVIGKRVADAVAAQSDMRLVGVSDVTADWRLRIASEKRFAVFAANSEAHTDMSAAGIKVQGGLANLRKSDAAEDHMLALRPRRPNVGNGSVFCSYGSFLWQVQVQGA